MPKRIRAARHYQRKDDASRKLADKVKPALARDLRQALGALKDSVNVDYVAQAMRQGINPVHVINWHHFREVLKAPGNRLAQLHADAAALGARKINGAFTAAGRRVHFTKDIAQRFTFDSLSPAVQQKLREAQDDLIEQLDDSARDAIETVITDGARTGASIDDMAESIRDVIGLTDTQAQAALNYQAMLYDLDPQALARQLRNAAYDDQYQDAIDSGDDLQDATVDAMVGDYVDNYLDYRAAMIARTEATNAAASGLHDAYSQAIDRGVFTDDAVKRYWQLADHPCPICESIPDMNENGVGVGDDFDSIDGPIDDPSVHPNAVFSNSFFVPYGVISRMVAAKYDGPAITLLAGQHRTTIGPNHPMLTTRGMVAAKFLKIGDKLIYDRRMRDNLSSPAVASQKSDLDKIKFVDQAFRSLDVVFGHTSVAAPANDLHGDVVFCKNEIDVIFPDRKLLFELDSLGIEAFRERGFNWANMKTQFISDLRFSAEQVEGLLLPSAGGVGSGDVSHFVVLPITELHKTVYKGRAFDCTTATSLYCSDGFVVSNCECSVEYITDLTQVPDESEGEDDAADAGDATTAE